MRQGPKFQDCSGHSGMATTWHNPCEASLQGPIRTYIIIYIRMVDCKYLVRGLQEFVYLPLQSVRESCSLTNVHDSHKLYVHKYGRMRGCADFTKYSSRATCSVPAVTGNVAV